MTLFVMTLFLPDDLICHDLICASLIVGLGATPKKVLCGQCVSYICQPSPEMGGVTTSVAFLSLILCRHEVWMGVLEWWNGPSFFLEGRVGRVGMGKVFRNEGRDGRPS